jgi:nucleotide-binding universal stress UspA family protein
MSQDPNTATARPFVLVLGLNLGDQESSGYALDQAAHIASRIPGSQMHIVHVAPAETGAESAQESAGLLRLYVTDKMKALGAGQPAQVLLHICRGDAAREIAQLGSEVGADLIVVGSHKPLHLKSLFVGTTAQRVMATAKCPVFVAGPKPHPEPSHIIVIEPACPDCLARRAATKGSSWWCARHSENHHLRRHHVYSYQSDVPFEEQDAQVDLSGGR